MFYDLRRNPAVCPSCKAVIPWRDREAEEKRAQLIKEEIARKERLKEQERQKRLLEIKEYQRKLTTYFETDFLNSYDYYQKTLSQKLNFTEYQECKRQFIKNWLANSREFGSKQSFDDEQIDAIGAFEGHTLIAARAGSGKTTTLTAKVIFLNKHCRIPEDKILVLAFNKKAADELTHRLELLSGRIFPHVMTFHALAYAFVHPEESILYDVTDGPQFKGRFLQSIVDEYIRSDNRHQLVKDIMLLHFRDEWISIRQGGYDLNPDAMLKFRRSLALEGIDGHHYKSFGEKVIANCLFENNIKYSYEKNIYWNGLNYRPDFTIEIGQNTGVIIEYFGMEGDPDYDEMTEEKIEFWEQKPNWSLIQIYPNDISQAGVSDFRKRLIDMIEAKGVSHYPLSEEEIWLKIKDRSVGKLTKVAINFIQRCRKLAWTPQALEEKLQSYSPVNDVEEKFLKFVVPMYSSYLDNLKQTGQDDFDGLLQRAISLISGGETKFARKRGEGDLNRLEFVLIDEFQDFSELFNLLIQKIREVNSSIQVFCVGDDWQAINGFAGSNLKYFQNFESYFERPTRLNVSTNYRSKKAIVETGNSVMNGLGVAAKPSKHDEADVNLIDLSKFVPNPREDDQFQGNTILPVCLRILNDCLHKKQKVVLLSRTNNIPWFTGGRPMEIGDFLELIRSHFSENIRRLITTSTVHAFKGAEADAVIIIDGTERRYPLLHPDMIFTRFFGDGIEQSLDEERRLFYVAVTRAVSRLFIISEKNRFSPFLREIVSGFTELDMDSFRAPVFNIKNEQYYISVGNAPQRGNSGTFAIKELLKEEGYKWRTGSWSCWQMPFSNKSKDFEQYISTSKWAKVGDGIEVKVTDSSDEIVYRCFVDKGHITR